MISQQRDSVHRALGCVRTNLFLSKAGMLPEYFGARKIYLKGRNSMLGYRLSRQITCIFLSTAHTSRPSRASFHDHVDVARLASHVFSRTRRTRYNRDIVTMCEFFASTFRRCRVRFRIVVEEPRNIHRSYSYAAVTVNSAPHRFFYSGSIFHESVSVTGVENTLLIPACRIASNHASMNRIFFPSGQS